MSVSHLLRASVLACGVLSAGCVLAGDQVFLKSGDEIDGTVTEDNGNTVVVKVDGGGSRSFRRADVDTIIYGKKPVAAEAPPPVAPVEAKKTDDKEKKDDKDKKEDKDKKDKKEETDEEKEWKSWTPPPGLSGFPDHAKRMEKAKEVRFMDLLERLSSKEAGVADAAKGEIGGMGKDVLPYVVAGLQVMSSADTRTACMKLIGQLPENKSATKFVIEAFYAGMPSEGKAAWYQVQFIDAVKDTLPALTGQSFITVQARDALVQDGLTKYIEWYKTASLTPDFPPQLGEKKFDKTDPEYIKNLTEARKLKLNKLSFQAPAAPSDQVAGPSGNTNSTRPPLNENTTQRNADQDWGKQFNQRVNRDDPLKRPNDKTTEGQ